MINYSERIKNLREHMADNDIDMYFLPKSGELHYLTGIPKDLYDPTYANSYGDWACGVLIFLDSIYQVVPRMSLNLGHVETTAEEIVNECLIIEEGVPVEESLQKTIGNKLKNIKKAAFTKNTFSTTLISLKEMNH